MTSRRTLGLLAILALGAAVSGCGHLRNPFPNPFSHPKAGKYTGTGERIPVLGSADTLSVSDALKGQDFFLPDPQPVTAWPLPGGTPEQSVERPNAGRAFVVAWRRKFGRGTNRAYHVTAPPVAADGRIYVMDAAAGVSAYDLNDGREIWRRDLSSHGREKEAYGGGLALDGGRLYVTSGYRFVAALDASTGKLIWRTPTDAPVHAAPTVSGGQVFAESTDDDLMTFDAATGHPGWAHQALVEPARILASSSPAISGEAVIAPFASGELVALQTANGNTLWSDELSKSNRNSALSEIRDIAGRPVVYRGDVYAVSHSGMMAAIDLRTGAQRWTLPVTGITTPWPAGDVVYVSDTVGRVICISRDNGQIYWITDLNHGKRNKDRGIWSGPILTGPNLVLVSSKGAAVALNPKTGAVNHTLNLGSDALMTPIAIGDNLYVATEAAELIAIR